MLDGNYALGSKIKTCQVGRFAIPALGSLMRERVPFKETRPALQRSGVHPAQMWATMITPHLPFPCFRAYAYVHTGVTAVLLHSWQQVNRSGDINIAQVRYVVSGPGRSLLSSSLALRHSGILVASKQPASFKFSALPYKL